MLTIRELIKTLYNAFNQKLKNHRGNWEQNDPTADDYIKNRPFYTDENKVIKIIPKQTIMFSSRYEAESAGYANISLSPIIELVVGQKYDVVWDGMKYKCTAYEFDGLAAIGSNFIMNGSFDDEPFFIAINKEIGGAYIATGDANSHMVEVTTKDIKKIDKKYLPDGIVTENDLAPVAMSGDYYDLYNLPDLFDGNYNNLTNKPTVYTDVVRYNNAQNLTTNQKKTSKANIGAVGYDTNQNLTTAQKTQAKTNIGAVGYEAQTLTDTQKAQARTNIGAGISNFSGNYNDLTNKPTIPTLVQPDWNERSINSNAYIKNRICYEDISTFSYGSAFSNSSGSFGGGKYNFLTGKTEISLLNILSESQLIYIKEFDQEFTGEEIIGYADGIVVSLLGNPKIFFDAHNSFPDEIEAKLFCSTIEPIQDFNRDTKENYCIICKETTDATMSNGKSGRYILVLSDKYSLNLPDYRTISFAKKFIDLKQLDEKFVPSSIARTSDVISVPITAEAGQTIAVKAVDENGKPTEWETSSILSELEARGYIKVIQFMDGTSFGMPLQCNMTAEEIISNLTGDGVLAVYRRLYLDEHDPSDVYTSNVGPVTAADGGIRARKIDFNDGSAPIIVDASNNTITLDPDWVVPEEVALKSDIEILQNSEANQQLVTDSEGNVKWEDRTHYSYSELAVILPETTISGKKSAVLNQYSQFSQNLASDHEYTVVYNGTEYKCKTQYSDILCTNVLGNMSLASLGSDTGEPFFFNAVYNSEMTFVYFNAEGDHVISINDGEVENVSRLDTKYLPTTVPVIQSATAGQTIVVKSVDENGKPTEWETMDINEKALPLTGGTLSGDLYANGFYVNSPSIYPSVTFSGTVDEELEKFGMVEFHENHRGSIVSEMQDGSYKEYYQFPRPADTGTENAYYDVLTTKNPSESLAKLGGLPLTGGTLSGDLKLTGGTNQRKINIYRNIGDSQYELQHSVNYEGKGFFGVYKDSKEINTIKLGENSTEFSKPITVSGGATGDVAAQTRENLGITDGIPVPTTATVGQTVVVKAVDENGKPTEWEAKDIVTETEINSLMTALKSDIPTDEHINELISTALASFTNAEEVSY